MSEFSKLPPEVKPGDGGYWIDPEGDVKPRDDWQGNTSEKKDGVAGSIPPNARRQLAAAGIHLSLNSGEPTPPKDAGGFEKHIRKPRI